MKKHERRAVVCVILALLLAAGVGVFVENSAWMAEAGLLSAFNRHLYDSNGVLAAGTLIPDRDGDALSAAEDGKRHLLL